MRVIKKYIGELKYRRSRATDGNRKLNVSLPRAGKALVDDCGLKLPTRCRVNASTREKFNFRLPSVAPKRLFLSSLLSPGWGKGGGGTLRNF